MQDLQLAIGGQGHLILDGAELLQVAPGGGSDERAPAGNPEDQAPLPHVNTSA